MHPEIPESVCDELWPEVLGSPGKQMGQVTDPWTPLCSNCIIHTGKEDRVANQCPDPAEYESDHGHLSLPGYRNKQWNK